MGEKVILVNRSGFSPFLFTKYFLPFSCLRQSSARKNSLIDIFPLLLFTFLWFCSSSLCSVPWKAGFCWVSHWKTWAANHKKKLEWGLGIYSLGSHSVGLLKAELDQNSIVPDIFLFSLPLPSSLCSGKWSLPLPFRSWNVSVPPTVSPHLRYKCLEWSIIPYNFPNPPSHFWKYAFY